MIKDIKILDKYVTKQVTETFLISLVIFTSLIFATDAFITIVKQITDYGIPLHIAALLVLLKLPSMLIFSIPMGMLLATLLTVNKMNNSLEITILKACGVGINRISKPIFICSVIVALLGFTINEVIAPNASQLAKNVTIMAILKKNVPNGKKNITFKDINKKENKVRRFFHIASVENNTLKNITVLNIPRDDTMQVIYAKSGDTEKEGWRLNNGVLYTITKTGKILNTAAFVNLNFDNAQEVIEKMSEVNEQELNYFDLKKHLVKQKEIISKLSPEDKETDENKDKINAYKELNILVNEKIALPFTSIVFALMAIPLAITGPRAKFNRGLLFSILIVFVFYLLRIAATILGTNEIISPVLAAWIPNIVLGIVGFLMYRKKAYFI